MLFRDILRKAGVFIPTYFSLYSARNDQGRLELSNVVFIFFFVNFIYVCIICMNALSTCMPVS